MCVLVIWAQLKIRNLVAFLGGAQPKRFGSGSQILKAYWKSGCAGSHPVLWALKSKDEIGLNRLGMETPSGWLNELSSGVGAEAYGNHQRR